MERHLKYCGVEIEITSQKEPEYAHTELVRDLLAIVISFSARLYGARGGGKTRQGFRERQLRLCRPVFLQTKVHPVNIL
ncbi:hypothetical protein L1766_09175 [Thermovorax subterraneus]|nr:hypothetical protein [Thermovorax subterraneus]